MPRKGAKAPSAEDGLTGSTVTVVSGSIRTPDDPDALAVKLSIWATEVTMRADGAELGNWETSDIAIRAIDSTSFEFIAEGDQLIFTPDDPAVFGASSLVAERAGGSRRKGRKAKKKSEPGPSYGVQVYSVPADDRPDKRRAADEGASPKLSRRERKAAERAAAERAEAQGIGTGMINVDPEANQAPKRQVNVRAGAVPTPIGQVKIPPRYDADATITDRAAISDAPLAESRILESTVPENRIPESTVPENTVPESTVLESTIPESTVLESTIPESTVLESTIPEGTIPEGTIADRPVTAEDYSIPEPPSSVALPTTHGAEVAPVELPSSEPRPKLSRRGRRRPAGEESNDGALNGSTRDESVVPPPGSDEPDDAGVEKPNRAWIRALDVARKYDVLGLDRVPVNEGLRGQDHQHTWDHRVAPSSGLGKHICTICGEIRR